MVTKNSVLTNAKYLFGILETILSNSPKKSEPINFLILKRALIISAGQGRCVFFGITSLQSLKRYKEPSQYTKQTFLMSHHRETSINFVA